MSFLEPYTMMFPTFPSEDVSDSYYLKLGRFISAFANIEHHLHIALREYSIQCTKFPRNEGMHHVLSSLVGEMNIKTVIDNISRLVEVFEQKNKEKFEEITKHFSEIHKIRDKLCHKQAVVRMVDSNINVSVLTYITANKKSKIELMEFDVNILDDMSKDLGDMVLKIAKCLKLKRIFKDWEEVEATSQKPWRYKSSSLNHRPWNSLSKVLGNGPQPRASVKKS